MSCYDFKQIEEKWQNKWFEEKSFKAIDFHPTKPKYYVLYEFYGISGNLHIGHLKGTVPADAIARYKRLKGYNVLFPIGGDSFGLPAENAAIKKGINPRKFVADGMANAMNQSKKMGLSFDWDRQFCTSDEDYYKWTQWIFVQLFNHGKAYKAKGTVNYCPTCQTVLSNEDSQGGKCDRCHNDVIQVERNVWWLKMKEYSDRLLKNVDNIQMAENLKEAQRNWIGKSEGVQVKFELVNENSKNIGEVEIFTTCIETIYGVTFVTLAPENSLIEKIKDNITNYNDVLAYKEKTALKTDLDRMSQVKEKTGCKLEGVYAINPVTCDKVPVYVADFVLASYGTGAVMAVPAHDQRDYEFAEVFNIPKKQIIEGDVTKCAYEKKDYLQNNSKMINSAEFSGMPVKEAKEKITQKVVDASYGKKQINYKMSDWSFNRQRYWGEPIPIVFCPKCGTVSLNESDLPLTLPETDDYLPNSRGDGPLSKIEDWINCKCPKCGGDAKRESDTMPNWAGSSWYWLRYIDPHNDKCLADYEKLKYWGSADIYTGGTEHITRHVLYAFFWQNFLYEIGVVPSRDPFIRKMGSGLVLDDTGKKMSKSSPNGVSPMEIVDKYGADVARMHVSFLAAYEDNAAWTFKGIDGIVNFLDKVWKLPEIMRGDGISKEHEIDLNVLIKKLNYDYENLKLNTAISACMIFVKKVKEDGFITKEELRQFLICLNHLAPHITSEMYERLFNDNIINASFPDYDESKCVSDTIKLPVQVNGKLKGVIEVTLNSTKEQVIEAVKEQLNSVDVTADKVVFVPNKILNFIKK